VITRLDLSAGIFSDSLSQEDSAHMTAPPVSWQQLHSSTMRRLPLLEYRRKSSAIWYVLFRQSPYFTDGLRLVVVLAQEPVPPHQARNFHWQELYGPGGSSDGSALGNGRRP